MMPFSVTPEIYVPVMWEGTGFGFYCLFSYLIIFSLILWNLEESSKWGGIFCQIPLIPLNLCALEMLEMLGQHFMVGYVCVRRNKGRGKD